MVGGQLSREMEVNVPPCEAWDLYGTRRLAKLVEDFSHIHKIEVSYGGGGVGTILNITFVSAGKRPDFSTLKEKFTKVDNQKRLKEVEVIEGARISPVGIHILSIGFSSK